MTYITKSKEVEALRLNEFYYDSILRYKDCPEEFWVDQAIKKGMIKIVDGSIYIKNSISSSKYRLIKCYINDYIVKTENGKIEIVDSDDFENMYEEKI